MSCFKLPMGLCMEIEKLWFMQGEKCLSKLWFMHRVVSKGHDVLLNSARWRVGSGESIEVWNDAWLPSLEQPRILSSPVTGFEEIKVYDLIDPVSKQWDSDLLQGLFSSQEVELITSIPLCRTYIEDKLVWPYTSSDFYSVKSGYDLLTNESAVQPITANLT